ncbi:MAG: hypothetical protein KA085_09265 [Phenylobacterium sp.]|uniref:hypothetical protein n=1 Tax=Phenylobacterium sp. TaxID=1871053 RepID=UPI001B586C9D|nr:hypothetical protein [Phenylobacterium sp.]MBP7650599.1 hypothetical protein [Phenylobacterium sp.]MBP7816302.1 hypothetical protein [Phenylobacterium sp.]MBP9230989.1 hypothetical protein [Phenylobacterium sp.]MBP9756034.1 hypothetical protein [Phenylobacterium sp.]
MRIAVIGSSGSGKSTLAKRLGVTLNLPAIELDAINWRPGWKALSTDDPQAFKNEVTAAIAVEAWVTDGNYSAVLPAILARATHVVWLDYERPIIMWRVITRSFRRAWTREEIWAGSGNRETFAQWRDPDHPVLWAWRTFHRRRARYEEAFANPRLAHLAVMRLRHPREAEPLVQRLGREAVPG